MQAERPRMRFQSAATRSRWNPVLVWALEQTMFSGDVGRNAVQIQTVCSHVLFPRRLSCGTVAPTASTSRRRRANLPCRRSSRWGISCHTAHSAVRNGNGCDFTEVPSNLSRVATLARWQEESELSVGKGLESRVPKVPSVPALLTRLRCDCIISTTDELRSQTTSLRLYSFAINPSQIPISATAATTFLSVAHFLCVCRRHIIHSVSFENGNQPRQNGCAFR
jgi:hypothetical protein